MNYLTGFFCTDTEILSSSAHFHPRNRAGRTTLTRKENPTKWPRNSLRVTEAYATTISFTNESMPEDYFIVTTKHYGSRSDRQPILPGLLASVASP
jgi:hypothetical protein